MSGGLNTAVCMDPGCVDPGCGGSVDQGALVVSPLVTMDCLEAEAFPISASVSGDGRTVAVGVGDNTVRLISLGGAQVEFLSTDALTGMPLCVAADVNGTGFLVGCDDGSLLTVSAGGVVATAARYGDKWVEHLAVHAATGHRAAAVGKTVYVLKGQGDLVGAFTAPQGTVSGLTFSPDGTKIAAAHYNGVTAWPLDGGEPLTFDWKGAHTGVTWSPDGRFVVTATQENELHTWDLETGTDMRMSGYPFKVRTLSFTADSAFLAAAGADTVTSWPFEGGGPKGKAPLELGYVFNGIVTQVACHPTEKRIAAGYSDGTVLIGDIVKGDAITAKATGGGPVTALVWGGNDETVVAGTEDGQISVLRVSDG